MPHQRSVRAKFPLVVAAISTCLWVGHGPLRAQERGGETGAGARVGAPLGEELGSSLASEPARAVEAQGVFATEPAELERPSAEILGPDPLASTEPSGSSTNDEAAAIASDASGASSDATPELDEALVHDLASVLSAAESNYPGLRAATSRIRAARAQLDEAWVSPFFQSWVTAGFSFAPEVRGSPIYSPDGQVPLSNDWQPVMFAEIQGAIPLLTFGKLEAARDAARAGIRAAESDRARVRNQLAFEVRRAYFALQLALDVEQMLREGLPRLEEAIAQIDERVEAGDTEVNATDRYRLAAALGEVRARAAQIAHLRTSATTALETLTGIDDLQVPDCPIQLASIELPALTEVIDYALRERPEVRMLEAARQARQASLDFANAGFWPDIALTYRIGTSFAPGITDQLNPFIVDPGNYFSFGAGLAMRWSLDFWGQAYRVDRESALRDDLSSRTEEARIGMRVEISDAYAAVEEARARESAYGEARRDTRRWFISASQSLAVGAVETRELVDAVAAYFGARFNHLQAIHDFNTAVANLERVSSLERAERWEDACE